MDWLEITVLAAPLDVETVADLLQAHTHAGVAIEGDGVLSLKAYLPRDGRLSSRNRTLRRALSRVDVSQPLTVLRGRTVHEEDWANAWKDHFHVQRIGRIVIRPRWRQYRARAGEAVITLDPGMAFGTGQHPTTRMALLALQQHLKPGDRVLDLGTGSGILAIAAALLGASRVVALDTDALAVGIARENVAANGVEGRVSASEGSLGAAWPFDGREMRFDCVVANVNSATIVELAPEIVAAVKGGGIGITGGISEERVDDCRSALEQASAHITATVADGDWRTLIFKGA